MDNFERVLEEYGFHTVEICRRCGEHEAALEDDLDGLCYTCQYEIDFGLDRVDPFKEARPTKLTREDVEEIRRMYEEEDYTQQELADMFDVSRQHVSRIVRRERWI